MKRAIVIGTLLTSVLFTLQPATADSDTEPAPVSVVEEVITAPVVDLPVVEPVVATEPAPVPEPVVEPAVEAPVPEPVTAAPVAEAPVFVPAPVVPEPVIEAPAPVEAPVTVAAPAVIAPAETLDDWLVRVCNGPQLGDAYMGLMRNCHWQEAVAMYPTHTFVESGFTNQPGKMNVPSVKYPGIIHVFELKVSEISTPDNTVTE